MGGAAGAKTTKYGPQRGPQGKPLGKKKQGKQDKAGGRKARWWHDWHKRAGHWLCPPEGDRKRKDE